MKKSLLLSIAVTGLLAAFGLEAGHGGGHHGGGHHGGGHHHGGWRHGGWGHRGWGPRFGVGLSLGGPSYYESPIEYIDDPYDWYWGRYPRASWGSYRAWLETNAGRFRRPWSSYYGPRYYRRWQARPSIGFGIGFGI